MKNIFLMKQTSLVKVHRNLDNNARCISTVIWTHLVFNSSKIFKLMTIKFKTSWWQFSINWFISTKSVKLWVNWKEIKILVILSAIMLSDVMLTVKFYSYSECHCAEFHIFIITLLCWVSLCWASPIYCNCECH